MRGRTLIYIWESKRKERERRLMGIKKEGEGGELMALILHRQQ
jgi:hypothetical protein